MGMKISHSTAKPQTIQLGLWTGSADVSKGVDITKTDHTGKHTIRADAHAKSGFVDVKTGDAGVRVDAGHLSTGAEGLGNQAKLDIFMMGANAMQKDIASSPAGKEVTGPIAVDGLDAIKTIGPDSYLAVSQDSGIVKAIGVDIGNPLARDAAGGGHQTDTGISRTSQIALAAHTVDGSVAREEMVSGEVAKAGIILSDPSLTYPDSSQKLGTDIAAGSADRQIPLDSISTFSSGPNIPVDVHNNLLAGSDVSSFSQQATQLKGSTETKQLETIINDGVAGAVQNVITADKAQILGLDPISKTQTVSTGTGQFTTKDEIQIAADIGKASNTLISGETIKGLGPVTELKVAQAETPNSVADKSPNDISLLSSSNVAPVNHQDAMGADKILPAQAVYRPINSGPLHPDEQKEKSQHNKTKKTEKTVQQVTTKNITLPNGHKVVETKTKTVEVKVTETTNLSAEKNGVLKADATGAAAKKEIKSVHDGQVAAAKHDAMHKASADANVLIDIGTDLAATDPASVVTGDHLVLGVAPSLEEIRLDTSGSAAIDQNVSGFDSVVERALNGILQESATRESARASHEIKSVETAHDPTMLGADVKPEMAVDYGHSILDAPAVNSVVSNGLRLSKVTKDEGTMMGKNTNMKMTSRKAKINISHGNTKKTISEIDLTASKPEKKQTDVAFIIVGSDGHGPASPLEGLAQTVDRVNQLETPASNLITAHDFSGLTSKVDLKNALAAEVSAADSGTSASLEAINLQPPTDPIHADSILSIPGETGPNSVTSAETVLFKSNAKLSRGKLGQASTQSTAGDIMLGSGTKLPDSSVITPIATPFGGDIAMSVSREVPSETVQSQDSSVIFQTAGDLMVGSGTKLSDSAVVPPSATSFGGDKTRTVSREGPSLEAINLKPPTDPIHTDSSHSIPGETGPNLIKSAETVLSRSKSSAKRSRSKLGQASTQSTAGDIMVGSRTKLSDSSVITPSATPFGGDIAISVSRAVPSEIGQSQDRSVILQTAGDLMVGSGTKLSDTSVISQSATPFGGDTATSISREVPMETVQSQDSSFIYEASVPRFSTVLTDSMADSGTRTSERPFNIPRARSFLRNSRIEVSREGTRRTGRQRDSSVVYDTSLPRFPTGLTEGLTTGPHSGDITREMRAEFERRRRGQRRVPTGRPRPDGVARRSGSGVPSGAMGGRSGRLIIDSGGRRYNPESGFSSDSSRGRLEGSDGERIEPRARGRYRFSSGGVVGVPDVRYPDLSRIAADPRARGRYQFSSGGVVGVPDVPYTDMRRMTADSRALEGSRRTLVSGDRIVGHTRDGRPVYALAPASGSRPVTGLRPRDRLYSDSFGRSVRRPVGRETVGIAPFRRTVSRPEARSGGSVSMQPSAAATIERGTVRRISVAERSRSSSGEPELAPTRLETRARAATERGTVRRISAVERSRSSSPEPELKPTRLELRARARAESDASRVIRERPMLGRRRVIATTGEDVRRLQSSRLRGDTSTADTGRRVRLGRLGSGQMVGSQITVGGSRYIPVEVPYTFGGRILPGGARYVMPPVPHTGVTRSGPSGRSIPSPMFSGGATPMYTMPSTSRFMRPFPPLTYSPMGPMYR